jgi:hypothetical protein
MVLAALAALASTATAKTAGRSAERSPSGLPTVTGGNPLGLRLVTAWLATTVIVLALEHPLWRNHVAHLIPPAALLIAAGLERPLRFASGIAGRNRRAAKGAGSGVFSLRSAVIALATAAGAAVLPYHAGHVSEVLWPAPPGPALAAARADLRALPAGGRVISDDPGVVWRAGRRTPADLVDASILRIESGRLTAQSLARAAADQEVCAVLVWSHRFGDLAPLPDLLQQAGYSAGPRYGGPKVLWRRPRCVG